MSNEQTPPEKPNDWFTDTEGRDWRPKVTTPVLIKTTTQCNVMLNDLVKGRVNAGALLRFVWFSCEYQAKTYEIASEAEFFEEVLTLDMILPALAALSVSLVDSFPEMGVVVAEALKNANPFVSGS